MDVVTDDLARVRIGDQAQVQWTAQARQVGNIRHPDTPRSAGQHLLRARLEQIGMAVETMKAMGGLVVRPLGGDQQMFLRQDAKQAIPSYANLRSGLRLKQEVQLARAQSRLTHLHVPDELNNLPILLGAPIRRAVALVIAPGA